MRNEISLIICIIGGLVYVVIGATEPNHPGFAKLAELGRLMFWVGLLAFLLVK